VVVAVKLLEDVKLRWDLWPTMCIIEEPYVHAKRYRSAALQFMFLHQLELDLSEQLDCPVAIVSPKQVKKAATGSGNATKEEVKRHMRPLFSTLGMKEALHEFKIGTKARRSAVLDVCDSAGAARARTLLKRSADKKA
jgi:hypothetical protein